MKSVCCSYNRNEGILTVQFFFWLMSSWFLFFYHEHVNTWLPGINFELKGTNHLDALSALADLFLFPISSKPWHCPAGTTDTAIGPLAVLAIVTATPFDPYFVSL